MKNGAHQQYKKRQVEGVDQGTLIVMLYDGAIKFLMFAKEAIDEEDIESAHNNIIRAQAVINELMNSLKVDVGEVAVNLLRLYEFMIRELCTANAKKDKSVIDSVIKLLTSLKDGWVNVISKLRTEAKVDKVEDKNDKEEVKKAPIDVAV
jgi:flagellar protein FliS